MTVMQVEHIWDSAYKTYEEAETIGQSCEKTQRLVEYVRFRLLMYKPSFYEKEDQYKC